MRPHDIDARPGHADTLPRICALLGPREQTQVEVATGARLAMLRRATVTRIYDDLANGHADGAIVSVAMIRETDVPALIALVRDLPRTPIVGLVGDDGGAAAMPGTLLLGRAGIARLVDVRDRTGWTALRDAFTLDVPEGAVRAALATILDVIETETDGTRARCAEGLRCFLAAIFAPHATTARGIAEELGLPSSTLTSRLVRAGLPSPKQYLALATLGRAAYLGEAAGLSIRAISERLQLSSPQSYGRTVRHMTGMTASEFRRAVTGAAALERFTDGLIMPYRAILRSFDPLRVGVPGPVASRAGRAA